MIAQANARPVAVYGALRSGTTMLRLMIDAHPLLSCPGETDFIFDHLKKGDGGIQCDRDALEQNRIFRNYAAANGLPAADPLTPEALVNHVRGLDRQGLLMLHRNLEKVLEIFPEMRFIHLVRDPRDVARSSIPMGWAGTVWHGAAHWVETEGAWNRLLPHIDNSRILRISYETLIDDPETELRKLCAFCGVAYDAAMLSYDQGSTYSKPDPHLTFQWKRTQTRRETELVETRIGPLLEAAGYQAAYPGARPPGAVERVSLFLRNKWVVWRHRSKRYGLRDPLLVAIAFKLRSPALARNAQRRIDNELTRHLK